MRKAADDIGISHTVISRHIRNLEAWIGWKLLTAGPRGAVLTPEGHFLHAATAAAFQSIASVAAELRSKAGTDELHIWCVPGLATRWLIPRLAEIRHAISSGEVLLRAIDRIPDFTRGEADMMVGFGDFANLPERAIPLLQPRMFPVVSPAWLEQYGMPKAIDDLIQLPLIHEESHAQWIKWFRLAGVEIRRSLMGPRLWDASLGFDAALAGQGVALTSNLIVAQEIEDGRLIELFDTDICVGGYFLLTSESNRQDERIDRFKTWIQRMISDSEFRMGLT
jgi:DNA-binding transcriptional LysR family regulator